MTGIERQSPEPFSSLIDKVCDDDRQWFERHPFATERFRRYVDGEFWPIRLTAGTILVRQLEPGMRTRIPIDGVQVEPFDADEAAIFAEHIAPAPEWLARGELPQEEEDQG